MSGSRLSAIEEKRAKLEELRRQRKIRVSSLTSQAPQTVLEEPYKDRSGSAFSDAKYEQVSSAVETQQTLPAHNSAGNKYASVSIETDEKPAKSQRITYDKATQTMETEEDIAPQPVYKDEETLRREIEAEIRQELASKKARTEETQVNFEAKIEVKFDEDKLAEFVGKSLHIVDKTLASDANIFVDYQNLSTTDFDDSATANEPLKLQAQLHDEIINGKSITSFDWSPFNPNLLAASYSSLPPAQFSRDKNKGVIIVWNIRTSRPEFIFAASTEILTVKFSLHKKTVLFGGGYDGKILQFDVTSNSRFPVSESPLSSRLNTHAHPVYCILQTNSTSTGAGDLVTCSTDGKICQWSPFLLDKPIYAPLQLKSSASRYDEDIIYSMIRLSNGSFLLGGSSLTLLENFQTKNNFKQFDPNFSKLVTGLDQIADQNSTQNKIVCCSMDSIHLYNELGDQLKEFHSSSIIMDIAWLDADTLVAGAGLSLELFKVNEASNYSFFELATNEYINKVSANNDGLIAVGTEKGYLMLYRYNR